MRDSATEASRGSSAKTADYIYAHLQDLTQMARQSELAMLVYLLEMAQIEAMEVSKQIRPGTIKAKAMNGSSVGTPD
ncbi:hypothetical protein SAMN04515647_4226 [Cohaesibacter sp. ES.047]|uniref:hypothetical protein n=1 Tax=Cohaesibacter sp. ES.047 TaxID=1798205 RepID=UPI000BB8C8CD|nr:hypothetical protein [Cohaesibacter sp. ES.047]SNY93906.1 hypothetical protein SAMN04515647_4226 [Cohaesibacter sp. ES.047]